MKVQLKEIAIRDVVENYSNEAEDGVYGYNYQLNIRPKYQREFVYDSTKRNEVIKTIMKGFPLNSMYWVSNKDHNFELLDGQQRTISICEYVDNNFSIYMDKHHKSFHSLTKEEQNKILDYRLMVYICEGSDKEKLDWFEIVNIAGEKLTKQELRNAVYTGRWLTDAKRYFSKTGCPAYEVGKKYIKGSPIRQEFLETAIKWVSGNDVEGYMDKYQNKSDAKDLWQYFSLVVDWVEKVFVNYRREMKGVDWGSLYNQFGSEIYNPPDIEKKVARLMIDEDIQKKSGIYYYIFDGKEKHLNIRAFPDNQKREAFEKQEGVCPICKENFNIEGMEADHIMPWHLGGKTIPNNCQLLCTSCNRKKSGR